MSKGTLTTVVNLYRTHMGTYPTTQEGMQALVTRPIGNPGVTNWRGPYLEEMPIDPWGTNYLDLSPGIRNPTTFDIRSMGPDGISGTADDVGNGTNIPTESSSSAPK